MSYRTLIKLIDYKYLLLIPYLFITSISAEELVISKYKYSLDKSNIQFGISEQTLIKNNSYMNFNIISKTAGIFKMKKDDRLEATIFKNEDGIIKPVSYKFSKEKKDKVQLIETFFDLDKDYAYTLSNDIKHEHIGIPYSLDRLSVQIDFQNKMKQGVFEYKYNIIDKGRVRKYSFVLHSSEVIETVFGMTNTIVIQKLIENNKRSTLTWYAVDYDYVPVKIEQYRKKALKFTATLISVDK